MAQDGRQHPSGRGHPRRYGDLRRRLAGAGAAAAGGGRGPAGVASAARRAEGEELARRFFEAAAGGDLDALLGMLAPDVVFQADGGGKAQAIAVPLHGQERVARLLAGLFRRGQALDTSVRLAWVNGQPGAVGYDAEGPGIHRVRASISPTAWSRRSTPSSIPTSSATSDRCQTWPDCQTRNYRNTATTRVRKATDERLSGCR